MLKVWKRFKLRRVYTQAQSYATRKKMWGNNIATLIVMNTVFNDYAGDLFDSDVFVEKKRNLVIHSSFATLSDMINWLNDVRLMCKEASNGQKIELSSGVYAGLNIQKQSDVTMNDFLIKDTYPIDLNESVRHMHRIINEISSYLGTINNNQRQYFDLRLGNGLNTLLVFHELLLEVMINE